MTTVTDFKTTKQNIKYLTACLGKTDIYSQVKLDGEFAHACNGNQAIKVPFETDFTITVDGKRFIAALSQCNNEPGMKITDSNLIIRDKNLRVLVPINTVESFPEFENVTFKNGIKNSDSFLNVLAIVKPFATKDEYRSHLSCVYLNNNYVYAADGYTLARYKTELDIKDVMLPLPFIDLMLKMGGVNNITKTDNGIYASFNNGCFVKTAMLAGAYPESAINLIPDVDDTEFINITDDIKDAVNKVAVLSDELILVFDGDSIRSNDESIIVNGFEPGFTTAGFNKAFVLEVLKNSTKMRLVNGKEPSSFKNDDGFDAIIMPVSL